MGITPTAFAVEHPTETKNGDYSTNVAMVYAKQLGKNPRAFAEEVVAGLLKNKPDGIEKMEIAGAGFINLYLSRDFFTDTTKDILKQGKKWGSNDRLSGKKIMVEYTQPNPFKPFHIGHLMSNAIGESISRIVEFSDARTIRANYQGDVGLHVGKSIYGLLQKGKPDSRLSISDQAVYIGTCYSEASNLYDTDENIKKEIDIINKKVYERSDPTINELYDWGRRVTLDAFEILYKILGTKFDYYFFESDMASIGAQIVKDYMGKVFDESDGAIVFHAEKYDPKLHTRVFITKQGLPTYEAKEIGLTMTKFEKENPDVSITETAIEQGPYMEVVQKAISLIHPDYESRMKHVTHGMMRVESGKMSSRKGNIITGESLLRDTSSLVYEKLADRDLIDEKKNSIASQVAVGAIKYAILKQAIGGNIIYDEEKLVSFEGDSGPYLQYSATRAASVLKKAEAENISPAYTDVINEVTPLERALYKFPEIVNRASIDLAPHHIVTYLIELATSFNSFYANHPIVVKDDPSSNYKVALTQAFLTTMTNGLLLLGICVPEKM